MPTVVTRGVASARGYGFAGVNLSLKTVIFTSSTTWTAPSGVTSLDAVIGQGGSSTSDFVSVEIANTVTVTNAVSGSGTNPLPLDYASVAQHVITAADLFNSGTTTFNSSRTFTFYPNNTFSWSDTGNYVYPYTTINGTWDWAGSPTSGNLNYGDSASYYSYGDAYLPGTAGGSTTAFGYTFSGASQAGSYPNATGQAATPVTHTSVAVSPGTGYAISVASGGSVTIQYTA